MNKVYVITGTTSGIGKELLKTFSNDKSNIVFAGYRNSEKLPQNIPSNVIYFYIDFNDDTSIDSAANFIKSKTKKIDTLLNVAGTVVAGPIEKIPIERLKEQFQVNTFAHLKFAQSLVDILINGKIINVSSEASFGNFPFISPYCASKRALDIFFNAFELENHKNIKVVSVKPGVISTPIWETSVNSNADILAVCDDYAEELAYLKENALKNTKSGLRVQDVASLIEKIDKKNYPKSSYTIGVDAKLAQFFSYFPQDVVNKFIKFVMKNRMKKHLKY